MACNRIFLGGILVVATIFCMAFSTQGVTLNVQNQCGSQITVYWQSGTQPSPNTVAIPDGGLQPVDVGDAWTAGVVWGGNSNRALAGLAEFTILDNGPDTYDISLVNAYNLGIEIQPITPSGDLCRDISCDISNVQGFCTPDNVYTPFTDGNWEACTNTDGPQPATNPECCCPTANTMKFKTACPDAYSFSKDDRSSTFNCDGVTDYNIIFCPRKTSNNNLPCNQG